MQGLAVFARAVLPGAAVAALAGLVHAQSIAFIGDGQPRWWLQLLSLALLAALLMRADSAKAAACVAWAFATAWFAGTFWWLFISMHTYGGLPAVLAVAAVLALAGSLAVYHAVAGAVFWLIFKKKRQHVGEKWRFLAIFNIAFTFACTWLLAELARAAWFTGFPWGASGYAHVDAPWIAALAPSVGVYGVGALAAFVASLGVLVAQHARSNLKSIAPGALATLAVLGAVSVQTPRHTLDASEANVVLLQGNIPQNEKFVQGAGIERALNWYGLQIAQHAKTGTLVIAPETALPLTSWQFERIAPGYLEALQKHLKTHGGALLTGIPLGDDYDTLTNGVRGYWTLGQPEKPYEYSKHHLVPFGEFIPSGFKWFTRLMNIPLGDFSRGRLVQPTFRWGSADGEALRWGPHICYEDLFGEELAARFAPGFGNFTGPGDIPDVMVNFSNIGWFGNSVAIDQHLHIARMRALELQRPFVRATNTGATVAINHRGEVTHSLPRHTVGALQATVRGQTGITPYAFWAGLLGHWPLWALGVLGLAIVGLGRAKTAKEPQKAAN